MIILAVILCAGMTICTESSQVTGLPSSIDNKATIHKPQARHTTRTYTTASNQRGLGFFPTAFFMLVQYGPEAVELGIKYGPEIIELFKEYGSKAIDVIKEMIRDGKLGNDLKTPNV